MKRVLLAALAGITFTITFLVMESAYANPFEKTLSNGLRVIVKEDHRAPTVVHMVWYRVGSLDEIEGSSGVAHALEHLMFKGTKDIKQGVFTQIVAAAGGQYNAFTSHDYTAYFQQVPASKLKEMMVLEADRMAKLVLDPIEFGKEMKVVMEERRLRTEDDPQARVYEALMATAFQTYPYRRPIIGWMNDLEQMTVQDARAWYDHWYAPNNAHVVIVGDVNKEEVFRIAEETYGTLPQRVLYPRKHYREVPQAGIKRVLVKAPAKLPYVAMAYKVPALRDVAHDREAYALSVLTTILDGHEAARLPKNLVRNSRIAVSVSADYDPTVRGEALFVLDGTPSEGHTTAELETALKAEITHIQTEGISEEELKRVKIQTIAKQIYRRDSMYAQAMEIGTIESIGFSWKSLDIILDKIRSVTAAEVQAVAKKYFNDDQLTVAVLDPQAL